MHFVVAGAEGSTTLEAFEGKRILLGKGSFGATEGEKYLELFGLMDDVTIADAELSNAGDALTNGQIDGFVTAGSFPAPNVVEAAASQDVRLLSLSEEQVAQTGQARVVIPADVYPGQAADIVTTGLPVIAFTTTAMDDDTAYELTMAFWTRREAMPRGGPASRWSRLRRSRIFIRVRRAITRKRAWPSRHERGVQCHDTAGSHAVRRVSARRLSSRADFLGAGAQPGGQAAACGTNPAMDLPVH